ncbi:aldose 1-epimerase [Georgenia faecalis]|uniref:Aldose 1-epimerase n=1 Tax=Georgenia faecalis TaxID=2483799 RepID=A0ABV9DB27_9MICO|nr:aldose 1-epimerase [Georgenia faecalis]
MTHADVTMGGIPTVVLEHDGARLEVAAVGATVLSWSVPGPDGGRVELAESYRSAEELEVNESAAFAVMAPFSNRIMGGTYRFDGVDYDLRPGLREGEDEVIHGLVRRARWDVEEPDPASDGASDEPSDGASDGAGAATLTLTTTIRDQPGYPFPVDVRVTYTLGARTLGFDLAATNVGASDAPVSLGWHPYFRLPGHDVVDGLELTVPGRLRIVARENYPLDGDAAYAVVPDGVAAWRPIGTEELDVAFVLPETDDVRTVARSTSSGDELEVRQDGREAHVMHVYTGDTLSERQRQSLAMEPVGLMTNAFNRPDCAAALPLAPGATRRLRASVEYRPGGREGR